MVTFVMSFTIISATCQASSSCALSSGRFTSFRTAFLRRLRFQRSSPTGGSAISKSRSYLPSASTRPNVSPLPVELRRHNKSGLYS
uniref:Putative secreted protein n=1 Tax=Anopheles darlingi TaxID=43151 RepID=A0A2M4DBE4_ANODA